MYIEVKLKAECVAIDTSPRDVDFHPTQPWLLTGHLNGDVKIHNTESGKDIHSFNLFPVHVYCVKFIARKNWYVVGSSDGKLRVFDYTTHDEIVAVNAHSDHLRCLAVHPAFPIVFTGSQDHTIKAWNWDKQWENIQTYEGHTDWVNNIAFNPKDPNTFASASHDGTVKMWSTVSPFPAFTINAHNEFVTCVSFYPGADKPYLISASTDETVKVWDYLSQTCVQTIERHTDGALFAVFHPRLPIIITGGWDSTVKIWNSNSYGIEHTLKHKFGSPWCIALRKDTNEVAVGFGKGVLTFELTDSGRSQMPAPRGDMSGQSGKERIERFLEGRDMEELAITDPEQDISLAQSSNNLITSDGSTLSPTLITTTLPRSHRVHQHRVDNDRCQQCTTLAMKLISTKITNKLISELRGDKAQYVVDFLSKMVSDNGVLTQRDRKHTLYLLSKLAKSAVVFPRYLVLKGTECNLADPVTWGGYGVIYQGEHEGSLICVKAVQADSKGIDEKKLRAHASELTIWAHLDHPNVLPFLGIYLSVEKVPRICIVSPWMVNGDLLQYLEMAPDVPRKPLVRDIISGLQYLHDLDIIHADLKAKNVLVSETGKAMLADFGISRLSITLTTILTNMSTGTVYWMAPELHLDDEPSPSRESDIWAFACTCYEIISGMMPFSQYRHPVMLMGAFMRDKIVPVKPAPGIGWDEDVWSVATRCWQRDPASRPKPHELLDMINSFNFVDDRPSDPEFRKPINDINLDQGCIVGILDEIRQSVTV